MDTPCKLTNAPIGTRYSRVHWIFKLMNHRTLRVMSWTLQYKLGVLGFLGVGLYNSTNILTHVADTALNHTERNIRF
jgi:hypothetical protein